MDEHGIGTDASMAGACGRVCCCSPQRGARAHPRSRRARGDGVRPQLRPSGRRGGRADPTAAAAAPGSPVAAEAARAIPRAVAARARADRGDRVGGRGAGAAAHPRGDGGGGAHRRAGGEDEGGGPRAQRRLLQAQVSAWVGSGAGAGPVLTVRWRAHLHRRAGSRASRSLCRSSRRPSARWCRRRRTCDGCGSRATSPPPPSSRNSNSSSRGVSGHAGAASRRSRSELLVVDQVADVLMGGSGGHSQRSRRISSSIVDEMMTEMFIITHQCQSIPRLRVCTV